MPGNGTAGTREWAGGAAEDGEQGADGLGGKVRSETININDGQTFTVTIGASGQDTSFGAYSSAGGQHFNGYTDIANGDVFGRDGVFAPLENSGDGGRGGTAGRKEVKHTESIRLDDGTSVSFDVIDAPPTPGGQGVPGQSGCVVVYYDKDVN